LSLLVFAFALVQRLKYGQFTLLPGGVRLALVFFTVWLATSLLNRKFTLLQGVSTRAGLVLLTKTAAFFTLASAFILVALPLMTTSRLLMYGSCALFYLFEMAAFALYRTVLHKNGLSKGADSTGAIGPPGDWSFSLLLVDGALVLVSFGMITWLKRGTFNPSEKYEPILLLVVGLWLATAWITKKFNRANFDRTYNALAPCFKSFFLMVTVLAVIVFAFRLFYLSRLQVFGGLVMLLGLEVVIFYLYSAYRKYGRGLNDIETAAEARSIFQTEAARAELEPEAPCSVNDPVAEKLRSALDFFNPAVFDFISQYIDLAAIDRCQCALMSTDNLFTVENLMQEHAGLMINLHR